MDTPTKRCSTCREVKPLDEYHLDRQDPSGRQRQCRTCKRDANRRWREANLEYARAYTAAYIAERMRDPALRARQRAAERRYKRENPRKQRAQRALRHAVARGKIVKPDRCEDCGERFPARRLHGHHDDYDKPFDVAWLCHPCHGRRHARYKHLAPNAGADPDNVEA